MSPALKAMIATGLVLGILTPGVYAADVEDEVVANDSSNHAKDGAPSATDASDASRQNPGSPATGRRNRDSTQQQNGVTPGPGSGRHHDATADDTVGGTAPTVKSDQQSTVPANPSDPTDELRNRDSRKQQGDASRELPEPTQKQN
jgi:hypothetical protein